MLTRILTAAVGLVVFFAAFFAPPVYFAAAVLAVAAIMLFEMYKVAGCPIGVNIVGAMAAALAAAGVLSGHFEAALIAGMMLYIGAAVFLHTKHKAADIFAHGFVTAYIAVFMCFLVKIKYDFRTGDLLWVFILSWLTDTGAYFAGISLGRHKLCEHISPKKTVEGAIGGVVLCTLACVLYTYLMTLFYPGSPAPYLKTAAMGAVGAVLSQLGDLVASCIKRDRGAKDYGNILPGHGGLMDRFDSVVFIAPFTYAALSFILK